MADKNEQELLDELLEGLGEPPSEDQVTSTPATEPPAEETEAPSTEEPSTEPPEEEDYTTEAPTTEEEEFETAAPTTEAPLDARDEQIGTLMQANRDLLNTVQQLVAGQQPGAKGEEKPKPALDPKDFLLTQEELDRLLDEPELINEKLGALVEKLNANQEQMTANLAPQVEGIVTLVTEATKARDSFYDDNPDLNVPLLRKEVQNRFKAQLTAAQGAGNTLDVGKTLKAIAVDVRKDAGLPPLKKKPPGKKPQAPGKKTAKNKPTMPGTKAGRKGGGKKPGGKKRGTQQNYMDELI